MPPTSAPQHRTITLSDGPPIRIDGQVWPRIARASVQTGLCTYSLSVRQHVDGRVAVYARSVGNREWGNAEDYDSGLGKLLARGDDIPDTIREIGREIVVRVSGDREFALPGTRDVVGTLVRHCLAAMPAEDFD